METTPDITELLDLWAVNTLSKKLTLRLIATKALFYYQAATHVYIIEPVSFAKILPPHTSNAFCQQLHTTSTSLHNLDNMVL